MNMWIATMWDDGHRAENTVDAVFSVLLRLKLITRDRHENVLNLTEKMTSAHKHLEIMMRGE